MQKAITTAAASFALLLAAASAASAAGTVPVSTGEGIVVIPPSSVRQAGDAGVRAHTHVRAFVRSEMLDPKVRGAPIQGVFFETPASVACIYGLVAQAAGCNPDMVSTNASGGSKAIAIVDAYNAPNAASDLAAFSQEFGLPGANFQVVFASGKQPTYDAGWELEMSLDIEWAHAMAPSAKIYLVEAASSSLNDLMVAEDKASQLVAAAGGGEVTNSWGSSEFPQETTLDNHFATNNVVYFASSGDSPGVEWPSASAKVVAVGGTSNARNPLTGAFESEVTWDEAGGGISAFVARPSYQNGIAGIVGNQRGVPDIAAVANPITGVWVYDRNAGGWTIVGGTSVASPVMAGIVNNAGKFAASSAAELALIYASAGSGTSDVKAGVCGPYSGFLANTGWDFCSGNGAPLGKTGK